MSFRTAIPVYLLHILFQLGLKCETPRRRNSASGPSVIRKFLILGLFREFAAQNLGTLEHTCFHLLFCSRYLFLSAIDTYEDTYKFPMVLGYVNTAIFEYEQ